MSSTAKSLVLRRFSAWRGTIEIQYSAVPRFQEMCDDYDQIVRALAYWTRRSATVDQEPIVHLPNDVQLRATSIACDYLETLSELENEILQYLQIQNKETHQS